MISAKKNNTKKGKTSKPSSKPFFSKNGRSKSMPKSKPENKSNKKTTPEKETNKKESQTISAEKTAKKNIAPTDNNTTNNKGTTSSPSPQPLKIASKTPIIKKAPIAKNADEPASAEPQAGQEKTEETKAKPGPDLKLKALKKTVTKTSTSQGVHPVGENVASNAQKSAPAPANEKMGKAQEEQVEMMDAQEASEFDAKSFKKALLNSIAAVMPKDEEDAEKFSKDDRLDDVKKETEQGVATEKDNAAGPIEKATGQEPDVGKVADRQIDQLTPVPSGPKPNTIKTKGAAPPPKPASEVSAPLKEDSKELDQEMEELGVSDETLANSNEPTFMAAADAKKGAKTNAEEAPDQFRKEENKKRISTQNKAKGNVEGGMTGLFGMRKTLFAAVGGDQKSTMSEDELARKKVSTDINGIFTKTKKKVDDLLSGLDTEVTNKFDLGAKNAKNRFETFVARKMKAYKKERYGDSWVSWKQLRRVKDYVTSLPDEVNVFYVEGKEKFLEDMDVVLTAIADIVAKKLKKAKEEIATGKKEVETYVEKLPADLQKVGTDAATAVESKFDSLDEAVDAKKDELIQSITNKYKENVEAIDARIEEMKAANRGLIDQALQLLAGPLLFIRDMWNTLTGLLATIVEVVGSIISNPIGFASMLFSGISQGFTNFGTNILSHLQTGFIAWLTGAMGPIGITIPEDVFSLKGIFDLVMQVLGLTKDFIREKAVKLLGEETVEAMEKGVEIFMIIKKDGIMGLWEYLKNEFGDLKETVMGAIKEMLITQVVMAGIKWIMGLLNPAAAFVKAILLIIDVVKFFIERGSQIIELVQAFIEGVKAVASGSVGAVAKAIETALAKAIPVLIGFLAALLGLGGISSKVTKIIRKIKKRINKAIDKIILKARKAFGKMFGKKGKKKGKGKDKDKKHTGKETPKHKKIAGDVKKDMAKPFPKKKDEKKAAYLKRLRKKAKDIEKIYQKKLEKGIKIFITLKELAKTAKEDFSLRVLIKPNDTDQSHVILPLVEDGEGGIGQLDKYIEMALFHFIKLPGVYGGNHKPATARNPGETEKDESFRNRRDEKIASSRGFEGGDTAENESAAMKKEEEKNIAKIEKEIKPGIQKEIAKIQGQFHRARAAKHLGNNEFTVAGVKLFVDQARNDYIYPVSRMGGEPPIIDGSGLVTVEQEVAGFEYSNSSSTATEWVGILQLMVLGYGDTIRNKDKQVAFMVAGLAIEPHRYPINHATHIIALSASKKGELPEELPKKVSKGLADKPAVDSMHITGTKDPVATGEIKASLRIDRLDTIKSIPSLFGELRALYNKHTAKVKPERMAIPDGQKNPTTKIQRNLVFKMSDVMVNYVKTL